LTGVDRGLLGDVDTGSGVHPSGGVGPTIGLPHDLDADDVVDVDGSDQPRVQVSGTPPGAQAPHAWISTMRVSSLTMPSTWFSSTIRK
jgi:hypothetical protein